MDGANGRYRAVFEEAPDAILLVDPHGVILEANHAAARLFGYAPGELSGIEVEALVPAARRDAHRRHRAGYGHTPRARPMGVGMELVAARRDGSEVPVEISLSPIRGDDGEVVIAVVRDLRERRRLRDFGTAALRAAEDERGRIARELHDDTAQTLSSLLIRTRVMQQRLEDPEARAALDGLRAELRRSVEGIRLIARGLRPPELGDVGLGAALKAHMRAHVPGGVLELEAAGLEDRLPEAESLAVYRVVQEALSNAVRHGGGAGIRVRVHESNGGLLVEVTDRGKGFDPDATLEPGAGLGLTGMRERAELAGGRLEIRSSPGSGTCVRLWVPAREDVPDPAADTLVLAGYVLGEAGV